MERFKLIPEVCLIFIRDSNVLLLRKKNIGWQDGRYSLPARHGEHGETMREAAAREVREEIGITVKPEYLRCVHVQHRCDSDHSRVGFYFVPESYEGEPFNAEPEKCDELRYAPLSALPETMVAPFRHAVECYRDGRLYSEFGWH